jgi:tetratricopeptide (TPR) repeat protein
MMPRTTFAAAFTTTMLLAAAASAQEEAAAEGPVLADEATPEGEVLEASEEESFVEEEEYDDYSGEDFCGGGEETVVDLAYYELEAGNHARARNMLVEGLRTGTIEQWQRPYALTTLAEVQLHLGQYGQAIVNYRKALRLDPDTSMASHVGLATALYMRGSMEAARAEAVIARDALCSDQYSQVACFGAQAILARTATEASEREAASQAMQTIRDSQADAAEQLDQAERRLARRDRRARSRQS